MNIPNGVHLRCLQYLLVSTPGTVMPNGEPYQNTLKCWRGLLDATAYLDLVPARAFVDRRASAPVLYEPDASGPAACLLNFSAPWIPGYASVIERREIENRFPLLPSINVNPPVVAEPYAIELWTEKSTMNDILLPLAERHNLTLIIGWARSRLPIACTLSSAPKTTAARHAFSTFRILIRLGMACR